jgi:HEAT repeat protein
MAALGALARLGTLRADTLLDALVDTDPTVRRRAAGVAGQLASREPRTLEAPPLLDALTHALRDEDAAVVETAAWALGEWGPQSQGAPVEALCEVAAGQRDPLCREAAVAALGAIGAARALPVVLAALSDKPAVRRRAAIALAAFDSPDAEEGLRRCLEDRDWQVRQAAEDLLESY